MEDIMEYKYVFASERSVVVVSIFVEVFSQEVIVPLNILITNNMHNHLY